jgi:hypothetical protein
MKRSKILLLIATSLTIVILLGAYLTVFRKKYSGSPPSMITPYVSTSDIASINEAYSASDNAPWGFIHKGIDFFPTDNYKPFRAVFSGVIKEIKLWQGAQISNSKVDVTLEFDSSFSAVYYFEFFSQDTADEQIQLNNILVSEGQSVSQGDVIGKLYMAGGGSHVHFSLIKDGEMICPEPCFTQEAKNSILEILHKTYPGSEMCYC